MLLFSPPDFVVLILRKHCVVFCNPDFSNINFIFWTHEVALNQSNIPYFNQQVIDGFETLDAIEKVPVGQKNRPLTDIKIERMTIHANPIASTS